MSSIRFDVVLDKTAVREQSVFIVLQPSEPLPRQIQISFQPSDAVGYALQEVEHFRSSVSHQVCIDVPRRAGTIHVRDGGGNLIGSAEIHGGHLGSAPDADGSDAARDDRAGPADATGPGDAGDGDPGDGEPGGGRHPHRPARASVVRLERTAARPERSELLWGIIRRSTKGLSFPYFDRFVELAFCDHPRDDDRLEHRVRSALHGGNAGDGGEVAGQDPVLARRDAGAFFRVDAYDRLEIAAEIFVLANAGVLPSEHFTLNDRSADEKDLEQYAGTSGTLPYLRIVYDRLGLRPPSPLRSAAVERGAERCRDALERRSYQPCLIELIWSYWHEEAMLVQAMAAITQRFQNRRAPGERDPLANLEIDPLRPLNNLLWGYGQRESDRLSVLRRAHEYDHHYGFTLHGKAVASQRSADTRSKFLEAFHNLLYRCVQFYKEDDNTTHVADGFPVLNALKETHYVLSQGAHNQFGDLPATARKEMLVQQWLIGRPEMREFLGGRPMVAYPERWMDRVDTVKTLKDWTDVSVVHFHDLAVFGEQLLATIRWHPWSTESDPDAGKQWARTWRAEIQGYIHALRAVIGIDVGAEITSSRDEVERYLPPSVHLRRRLLAQTAAR